MKKITWIRISNSRKYGGVAYKDEVKSAFLERQHIVEEITIKSAPGIPRYLKIIDWFFKLSKIKGQSDIWIEDSFISIALTNFNNLQGNKIALIHHIDLSVFPLLFRPIFFLLERIFYAKIKKAKQIVTVSDYWKNHFLNKGYQNVTKIYNGFELSDFKLSEEEVGQFKKKYEFDHRPVIYIGNCQKAKGVVEVYDALKDLPVNLVTSGDRTVQIPARNLELSRQEYLLLLKSSSIVVAMSKFKEGWCKTAHEAMLSKTPVIGSGMGGMKELLEGGSQIICPNFSDLKKNVEYLLANESARFNMGKNGFEYAQQFSMEKLKNDWQGLIDKVV